MPGGVAGARLTAAPYADQRPIMFHIIGNLLIIFSLNGHFCCICRRSCFVNLQMRGIDHINPVYSPTYPLK